MKRAFDEISDEEWENHKFATSRVFKKLEGKRPPIESFAYKPPEKKEALPSRTSPNFDDDDEDVVVVRSVHGGNRVRRLVVDDDSDAEASPEVVEIRSAEEDDDDVDFCQDSADEGEEETDLVVKALQKCGEISASLREELYGSASSSFERYAEVDASAARIVTQEDINAACSSSAGGFDPVLKPYQLVGVNFLLLLYRKRIGGAILADEMGLGKTVQAVTYLNLLEHLDNDPGPHLIVCPASLLENWERELKKWCPSFSVILFHGAGRTTYSKELNSLGKAGLPPPFNVLVTSYSLFERRSGQQRDDRKVLKRWQWSCVLMDEAHALKDKSSYRWKSLMSVAKTARQRLMLTGTPLQNDLHELWSLLEFMLPDIFANDDDDLKKRLNADDKNLIIRIKSILGPFVLRRLKSDVMQQLTPKVQQVEYVYMVSDQRECYNDAIGDYRRACLARTNKATSNGSNSNIVPLPGRQISNYFMQFRKIANHPLLVRRVYKDEDVIRIAKELYPRGIFGFECNLDKVIKEIRDYNDYEIHQLLISNGGFGIKGALSDAHVLGSAKCQALSRLLPSLKNNGHRVLIFSQWTSMLDILEWALDVIGVTYNRLDGSTQVSERQTLVDTFNNDSSIFACLLSTRAGGQGLNLIGADTVIIHDMDFNPQIDRQAEDRCHRIGQRNPVTVYRLVTKETVDENVFEIAKRKLILDAAVLESGADMGDGNVIPEKTMGEILSALLLV
ncbi:SNF2 domain-containing protein / helicase domain-containing protein [Wolffia australiana]